MKRFFKWTGGLLALAIVALALLWATSPDPKTNPASFEDEPLAMGLAPLDEAVTLAQADSSEEGVATLLVTALDGDTIEAVDLSSISDNRDSDPFAVLAGFEDGQLAALAADENRSQSYPFTDLLPAAGTGERHIATGTNFPEHAEEASSDAVFQFPKFGAATPPRTTVARQSGMLLDYEIEMCMRFDRTIASLVDFDAAVKGLYLCGDFTDRATLIRLIDPDNLDSGRGFSDGKSGPDFYPAGGLLVIPRDWKAFAASERITTAVNKDPRQDARGGEMTLDFRGLAEKALGDMNRARFLFQDEYHRLANQPAITPDMTLMSGTAEGVIFTQPTRGDLIEGGVKWLVGGDMFTGKGAVESIIETFIESEMKSGHFLQPGDTVHYRSSRMGDVVIEVRAE